MRIKLESFRFQGPLRNGLQILLAPVHQLQLPHIGPDLTGYVNIDSVRGKRTLTL